MVDEEMYISTDNFMLPYVKFLYSYAVTAENIFLVLWYLDNTWKTSNIP